MKIKEFISKNKLTICFVLLIIGITFFISMFSFRDSDYFWHITAGDYMFNHGLLTKDIFSWSVTSKYWMSHEWLFEIIIYGFKCLFGNYHILIYCIFNILLLLLILFFSNRKEFLKNSLFGIIWSFLAIILMYYAQGRPQLISNILLALSVFFCMDLYKNKESKKIYFLPLISIIWANVHGGSSNLPYLLCFIFFIIGHFSFQFKKIESKRLKKKQLYRYFIVMILCIISVCINIHGIKMLTYPYLNMFDTVMIDHIMEWRSTTLHESFH